MTFKKVKNDIGHKGKYLIWVEDNNDGTLDVYSTDNIFWRDFFTVE